MTVEDWDVPIPGLDKADTGVLVSPLCQGRVQRCPRCDQPIVWAMRQAAMAPEAVPMNPVADERANGVMSLGRGGLWVTFVARAERGEHDERHLLHHCPTPKPPSQRRRTPNGPTQH